MKTQTKTTKHQTPPLSPLRRGRVTASSAAAALGYSPYFTLESDLIRAMVRDYHCVKSEFVESEPVKWGRDNEPIAGSWYTYETGNIIYEAPFFPYDNWLGATPDGIINETTIIEIKCPYSQRYLKPPEFRSIHEQPHYFAQVQIQLFCAGKSICHFYQWTPNGSLLEEIKIDLDWLERSLPKLKKFHEKFKAEIDNPKHLEPKRTEVNTLQTRLLAIEYEELTQSIAEKTQRKKEILDELVELANGKNARICGRYLTKISKKGAVAYAKVVSDLLPNADLSAYQGEPTEYWIFK